MSAESQPVFFARQPVFDADMNVVAWELLHRDGPESNETQGDRPSATARLLVHLLCDFDMRKVLEGLPAFVNFPPSLLEDPPDIDRRQYIIEVDARCMDTARHLDMVQKMWAAGYRISIDSYTPESPLRSIVQRMPYVRLDVRELGRDGLQRAIGSLDRYHGKIVAERIETHEEFADCRDAGAHLFQGNFLCRPRIEGGSHIPESKLVVMRLLDEVRNPDCSMEQLRNLLARDPKLSYTLLRLVNSANFRRAAEISSIQHALSVLGLNRLRSWITLIALCNLTDKPAALQMTAMQRARMCERMAQQMNFQDSELMFTAGMLSLLDAFFDRPMAELLDMLHLSGTLRATLEGGPVPESRLLQFVIGYEKAQWDPTLWHGLQEAGATPEHVREAYLEATQWAIATTRELLR